MKQFRANRILIPIDFSSPSMKAINPAVELAKLTKAEITLLHVIDIIPYGAPSYYLTDIISTVNESSVLESSNAELKKVAAIIRKKGVEKVNTLSVSGQAYSEIIRVSKKLKSDLIVMGTHGVSGVREFFVGSNTARVVSHASCPVLSVQKNIKNAQFKNIIVPFRDKPHSREKVMIAIAVAKIYRATLHVVGVDTEGNKKHSKKMALEGEQIKKIAEEFGVKCKLKIIKAEFQADTVLKYTEKVKGDLIIVTSDMDRVSVSEYFMGPFAQQIVNHSPIPVLSIRPTFNTDTVDLRFY